MKNLLLAALMFAGTAVFAVPTLVVDVFGEAAAAEKGNTSRITPIQKGNGSVLCLAFCFPVNGEQNLSAGIAAKKAGLRLRPSQGVGRFECLSMKVNGKEVLDGPIEVNRASWSRMFEVEASDGMMKLELQVRDMNAAK